jgi:uncharacterized delta-60 repeat protein
MQADGKIVVGGKFTTLGGYPRNFIGRLNPNGSLDPFFNPGANSDVYALAVQPDGKILVGGVFTSLGGQARNYLGRLNSNGTLDETFNPGANNTVLALAVLRNGNIAVGGFFSSLGGQTRDRLGILNGAGAVDSGFTNLAIGPNAINTGVQTLAVQADGMIIVGGLFSTIGGFARESMARLTADGFVDPTFDVGASFTVYGMALQADGKILAAGQFTSLGGQPRQYVGRLNNPTMATQDLSYDGADILWLRGGSSPEVWRTTFEVTTNGNDWSNVGTGQRIPGGWQVNVSGLATNSTLRARGFFATGRDNSSAGYVETLSGRLAISLAPVSRTNNAGTTASFRVLAGGVPALSYQWHKAGQPLADGGNLSGVTTPTLVISNVLGADAAGYFVTVSNVSGSVTSSLATLTVLDPFIATNPPNRSVNAGQNVTFTVAAGGTPPLTYQWRKEGTNLLSATNASLTLTNVQWADRGNYAVQVSNLVGAVTSSAASLTVNLTFPDAFNPGANSDVQALAFQPDGKIVVGGKFTVLGTYARSRLARLNESGTIDTNFNASTTGGTYPGVTAIALQTDGKILVGGDFTAVNGQPRTNLARLHPDGTLDADFEANVGGVATAAVSALAIQADGKILVGGWFSSLGGQGRINIGRLNENGSVDLSFNPGASGNYNGVNTIALQPDGKILVGGTFTSLAGQSRSRIGRLNLDGTLDTTFNPGAGSTVFAMAVQRDGKILVGGLFSTLGGSPRSNLGRLQPNGAIDTTFNPGAGWSVFSIALQADSRIIVGGAFTTLAGTSRSYLGRLHENGSLDPTFGTTSSGLVSALALAPDGKILVGGNFFFLGGQIRNNFGRLNNSEPANQELVFDGLTVHWLRGGTAPEIIQASFDISTNGTNWVNLGNGNRTAAGWRLADVSPVLTNSTLRALGQLSGGYHNGSSWFVEDMLNFVPPIPPQILVNGHSFGVTSNQFGFKISGLFSQVVILESSTNLLNWIPLETNTLGSAPLEFWDADTGLYQRRFYRVRLQ